MIIGFSGRAGAGKDTAANALILAFHRQWVRLSFATTLKRALCVIFGWELADWENLAWKETPNDACYGLTPRQVAQSLGTEWGREHVNPNLWVDQALRLAEDQELYERHVVFTDVRFPNEVAAIQARAGKVLYLFREGELRTDSSHASEQDISHLADVRLTAANGDITGLQSQVLDVVSDWITDGELK